MQKVNLSLLCLFLFSTVYAQPVNFDNEELAAEFKSDFRTYSRAYTAPVLDAFSYNAINGWSQTARIIRPYSVRIEFTAAATFTADENTQFNFNDYDFSDNIEVEGPTAPVLPTALGGSTENFFIYRVEGEVAGIGAVEAEQRIDAFGGAESPFNSVPNIVPQISVGLPLDFEVSARFFPYFEYEGVTHNEFGIGVKHGLDQYLNADENFHWNAGLFYDLNQFSYIPDDLLEGNDQKIRLRGSAFLFESLVSYDYDFISAFGGLGFYSWNSSFDILGTYIYRVEEGPYNDEIAFMVKDPVTIDENRSGIKASAGLTFRILKVVSLSTAYHLAPKSSLTVNLSFNIATWDEDDRRSGGRR